MACPRVVFQLSGRGRTALEAIRDASNRSVGMAWHFCSSVDSACPEPGATPIEAELLSADVVEGAVMVKMRFVYQCNAPGAGCLATPFLTILGQRGGRQRPDTSDTSLDDLITTGTENPVKERDSE